MAKPVLFDVSYTYREGEASKYNLHAIGDDGYLYYAYVTNAQGLSFTEDIKLEKVLNVYFHDIDLSKIQFASIMADTDLALNITIYLALPIATGYRFYTITGRTNGEHTIENSFDIANTIITIDAKASYLWVFLGGLDGITKINQETNEIKFTKLKDRVISINASMYPIVIVGTTKGMIISQDGFETDNYQYFIGGDNTANKLLPFGVGKILVNKIPQEDNSIIQLYMLQETGISRVELRVNAQQHIDYVWGAPLTQLKGYQFSLESPTNADWFIWYEERDTLGYFLLNVNDKRIYSYLINPGMDNDGILEVDKTQPDNYYNNDFSGKAKSLIKALRLPFRVFVLSPDKRLSINVFSSEASDWYEINLPN